MAELTLPQALDLAMQYDRAGRSKEAGQLYRLILEKDPTHAGALHGLGVIVHRSGEYRQAAELIQKALSITPDWPEACCNLGNALLGQGNPEEAIAAQRHAIALRSNFTEAYINLGTALQAKGRHDDAISAYRQALSFAPGYPEALINLGSALQVTGRFDEAIATYRQGLAVSPDFPEAHFNLSLLMLMRGDFARGWDEYEWRLKCRDRPEANRKFAKPQWDGSPLKGRTLLVHSEQGLGDAIQFVRYLPMITQRGATVVLDCQIELHQLFHTIPGGCKTGLRGEPLPHYDLHCALLSLPRIFKTTLENIPAEVPYLFPDPELINFWRKKLAASAPDFKMGLKIGLAWAGSATNKQDSVRSLSLDQFAPLARIPGVTFYSLQKGPAASQAKSAPPGLHLIDYMDQFSNFSDAALIVNLDLIISVDTSVAHLAGALARPTWILIPWVPDWRWMLDRDDSPWYPTVRLFRQTSMGDWPGVIKRVVEALSILNAS
jgi:Flp pilus assembly protein TadD